MHRPLGARKLAGATFLTLLSLGLSGCGTDDAARRKDGPVIHDLHIEGADQLSEKEIKEKILTTETPWWTCCWPFAEKEHLDPNAWQADLRRIERYYQARGYYDARVLGDEIQQLDNGKVDLTVRVKEGEPTRVTTLEITGLETLSEDDREKVLEDLPIEQGEIFLEEEWAGVKGLMQTRLRELGYAEALVQGAVEVDVATREATVRVEAIPGKRYRFGNIFVAAGARPKVPHKRVMEQAAAAIHDEKNQWYSETALAEAQARVFKMGVFGGVKVNRGAPDREAGTVPVIVDVREAPFRTIELGVGGGVDSVRNELRTSAAYTDRNFFGDLRRLTTQAKVGYAFIPNVVGVFGAEVGARHGLVLDTLAELEQPRFLFRDVSALVSAGVERGIEPAYTFLAGRGRLGVVWRPHPELSITPSYNVEGYLLSGQANYTGAQGNLFIGCSPEEDNCLRFLSYLEQTVEWDKRDAPLDPRRGYYVSVSFQEGGGMLSPNRVTRNAEGVITDVEKPLGLGGDYNYLRVLPEVRGYYSLFDDKITLAAKLRLGTLISADGDAASPVVARFFSGGGQSHRGFNSRRLSPLQRVETLETANNPSRPLFLPVGGNGLVETSFEVRYNIAGNIVLASFLDSGMVTREGLSADTARYASNLQHAVGIGVRYRTIVGPIRVDLAYRLAGAPLQGSETAVGDPALFDNTCFGLGRRSTTDTNYPGAPEGRCTFHLSIGEAF